MTGKPRTSPYAWVTWLSKVLAGEQPCEWSLQFQATHQGFNKVADSGDLALWTIEHSRQVKKRGEALRNAGYSVTYEDQNKGTYHSRAGLSIGFKPDIIAHPPGSRGNGKGAKIVDVKTGQPRTSDTVQMLLYVLMTGIPEAELYYTKTGQTVTVGSEAADKTFLKNLSDTIDVMLATEPAPKVPGPNCRWCKITRADCPERIETE